MEWSFQKGQISNLEWGEVSWDWVGVMNLDWCVLDYGVKLFGLRCAENWDDELR